MDGGDPRQHFIERVRRAALRMPGVDAAIARPADFALDVAHEGGSCTCFLGNLWLETREMPPEASQARIELFLSEMLAWPSEQAPGEEGTANLFVALRAGSTLAGPDPTDPWAGMLVRPVLPMLVEAVARDRGRSLAFLRRSELAALQVDEDAVFAAGGASLAAVAGHGIEPYDPRAASPIWHVHSGDDHEAGRLLVPGWLASFAPQVEGRPIAAIPHRAAIVVAGDARPESVARLARLATREYGASPRPISPALYTSGPGGRPVPWAPASGHLARGEVILGHLRLAADEHSAQGEKLAAALARGADAARAAPFTVMRREGGDPFSLCRWERGTSWLLPRTDVVVLADGDAERWVPWRQVEDRVEVVRGCFPARFRTGEWPE